MKPLDETTKKILEEVQKEILEEYGVELSVREVYEICQSQFRIANLAFKKGLEIRLPVFGSFVHTNAIEVFKQLQEFEKANKHLSTEAYQQKLAEFKIELKNKSKERNKERNKKENNETLQDVIDAPDIFKLPNIYDKNL